MKRITVLKFGLIAAVAIITFRLIQIQIIDHGHYVAAADAEHTRKFELLAERGELHMLSGANQTVPVVMNESVWTVFVDPSYVSDKNTVQNTLSNLLSEKITVSWDQVWSDMTHQYIEIAKNVNFHEITAVDAANLKGVGKKKTSRRVYPYGNFASQVLGFINAEQVGYGAEGALNEQLAGTNGSLKTVADVNNIPLTIGDDNVRIPAEDGKNIVLTLDENIQRATERALAKAMKKSGIDDASAIVMNPRNGQIQAVANLPSYNPESYWEAKDPFVYRNRVLDDPYEAASVCKTFTFATAIERGAIKPTDTFYNTGTTRVDDRIISNSRFGGVYAALGRVTMQDALSNSLNTGSIEALRRIGGGDITRDARNILYDAYYNRFGLGRNTGIELYEVPGIIISPEETEGNAVRYANMTFGYGLNLTMLQVAAAFSATVNGGNYYQPTIIAGELTDGKLMKNPAQEPTHRAISEKTSATMRQMLVSVRDDIYGNGDLPGYEIGAKSGTAEVLDEKGQYTSDRTIASFIGYGAAKGQLPEYVVLIRVGGSKLLWGSMDAEPVFTEISNFMLEYLKIKPKGK